MRDRTPPPPRAAAARRAVAKLLALFGLALFGLAPSGCAPGEELTPLADYTAQGYHLGSGDQVHIIVFGEDQLTGNFRVDDEGQLAFPLLGAVPAAGLTTRDLVHDIDTELRRRKLLSEPSVTAEMFAYRPVFVLGEVTRPGQYPYQPGMTMLTSVAVAGGFTYRGITDYARVVRTTDGRKAVEGKIVASSYVAPGDVIEVLRRRF